MEKLTLEHIAPYLPYGLKAEFLSKQFSNRTIAELNCENAYKLKSNSITTKPILRPMDLSKPIQVDGKEVIPIVEIAKIAYPMEDIELSKIQPIAISIRFNFEYYKGGFTCYNYQTDCTIPVPNQNALFKWLYANKFDVDRLIYRGLAIDVNTLEINPYE